MMNKSVMHLFCLLAIGACLVVNSAEAGQGCPFEDGSCQDYCSQQGCNLGYCGHFAWIQCICRKCGDEWNWYDKVHYNPDKQVNQTELDSLKLNVSAPIILTNNKEQRIPAPTGPAPASSGQQQQQQQQQQQPQQQQPQHKPATLTTLLIPDLSDGSKLDINDIPDENSEKFLDFLARNHEKLAQVTSQSAAGKQQSDDDDEPDQPNVTTASAGTADEPVADETVEIQISSSNNQQTQITQVAPVSVASRQSPAPSIESDEDETDEESQQKQQPPQQQPVERRQEAAGGGQMTRLLRMAVAERLTEDLY